jgi:hypothetical protein
VRQALDSVPRIVDEAVCATQVADGQLRNPGRLLAYGDGLLKYVVGEAESWLERRTRPSLGWRASWLGFPFGQRTGGVAGGVCVGSAVGLGEDPAMPLIVGVGAGLATTCRKLST